MALQATDLLMVNRGGVNYKVTAAKFNQGSGSGLLSTDLLMVQRGGDLYQLSLADMYSVSGKLKSTDYLLVQRGDEMYALEPSSNVGNAPYIKFVVNDSSIDTDAEDIFRLTYQGARAFNGVPPQLRIPGGEIIFLGNNGSYRYNTTFGGLEYFELYGMFDYVSFAQSKGLTGLTASFGSAQMFPTPNSNFGDGLYLGCSKLEQTVFDIPVKNGRSMFDGCTVFNQAGIGNIDTSSFRSMLAMFRGCTAFAQGGVVNFDVTGVDDMSFMFQRCQSFNSPLNTWGPQLSSVLNFAHMFDGASQYSQPMDTWDVSGAFGTSSMDSMFKSATVFNENLSGWCVTNVTSEPPDFAAAFLAPGNYPVWGTCP